MKDTCARCGELKECNFGMHGEKIVDYFCSVDCMIAHAKEMGYEPFGGRLNVHE